MNSLTIFTPTYNRSHCLSRCYESFKKQTVKNFEWLIVDDGSTDNTRELVSSWQHGSNGFTIRYIYKENGGLHTAYNTAIEHITTILCVCVDSDDAMPPDAVEKILIFWDKYGSNQYAGIIGLDSDFNGNIIGDFLPDQPNINLIDLLIGRYHIKNGDRTNVVRTELYKKYAPMPSFDCEKNFNPHYMHLQISKEYNFLVLNDILKKVEYQPNGMSASIWKQYYNSPKSFAETRRLYLSFRNAPLSFRLRNSIHYVSSSILAKDFHFLSKTPAPFLAFLSIPAGIALSILTSYRAQHRTIAP